MTQFFPVDKRPRDFDLIVIGGSLEGLACAKEAALLGASVCVVARIVDTEKYLQDRSFLNLLLHVGKCKTHIEEAKKYGWLFCPCALKKVSLQRLYQGKKRLVDDSKERLACFLDKSLICYYEGDFKFVRSHPITMASVNSPGDEYTATNIVLAPVGIYKYPEILGADKLGLLPRSLAELRNVHGRILVAGNGSDAVELASAFLQMGFDTAYLARQRISNCFDNQMTDLFLKSLSENGLRIWPKAVLKFLEGDAEGKINVHFVSLSKTWKNCEQFDFVVFVDKPVIDLRPFELQNVAMKTIWNEIPVNQHFQTNVPNIFAIGNVLREQSQNSGVDIQIGKNLAHYLIKNHSANIIHFTDIAGLLRGPVVDYSFIGMSEEVAGKRYGSDEIEVYHGYYKPVAIDVPVRALEFFYLKIICLTSEEDTILGMHLSGPNAASIMQSYAVAMKCGLKYSNLIGHPGIFPSVGREFTLLSITKKSGLNPKLGACCS